MNSSRKIKKFILNNLHRHRKDIISTTIQKFGISRQAILKHMHTLINEKQIVAYGKTRDRYYELRPQVNFYKSVELKDGYKPKHTIDNYIINHISSLKPNIIEIIRFSMDALLNNILDHSKATKFYFKIYLTYNDLHIILNDNGIGLFENIKTLLNFDNAHIAAIELAKGPLTTDPDNHSGDELFTLMHLFDYAKIESSEKSLKYLNQKNFWKIDDSIHKQGTRIHLKINPFSKRSCQSIFKKLFVSKKMSIKVPINLIKTDENQIVNTRAQAKSLLRNIEKLNLIEFDFNNIDIIGPAFADELIRNTKKKNETANIKWINSNKMIDALMSRAYSRFS